MWALNVPSKILIHMWRVANEFVPMLYNLRACKLVVNALCLVCQEKKNSEPPFSRLHFYSTSITRVGGDSLNNQQRIQLEKMVSIRV
ncbi:hypothetical protein Golax_017029 [Gossypium laxum]|uniref:Reverse transcriptase zinc-binding domain-containing protein n=1 Tax=Gossypium laxum TaxID=34288 RepID=A0A7J8YZ38_9ROSI|nr:hypothetical protein [Gossypium laxum]